MPSKKTITAVVEARCDIRDLATIQLYYTNKKNAPKTRSGLIGQIIEDFAKLVARGSDVVAFKSTEEADEYFRQIGFVKMRRDGKQARAYLDQLALEQDAGIEPETVETLEEDDMDKAIALFKKGMKE